MPPTFTHSFKIRAHFSYTSLRDLDGIKGGFFYEVWASRLGFLILFEHIVFLLKFIIQYIIPDIPKGEFVFTSLSLRVVVLCLVWRHLFLVELSILSSVLLLCVFGNPIHLNLTHFPLFSLATTAIVTKMKREAYLAKQALEGVLDLDGDGQVDMPKAKKNKQQENGADEHPTAGPSFSEMYAVDDDEDEDVEANE